MTLASACFTPASQPHNVFFEFRCVDLGDEFAGFDFVADVFLLHFQITGHFREQVGPIEGIDRPRLDRYVVHAAALWL